MGAEILDDKAEILTRLQRRTVIYAVTGCYLWQGALNYTTHGHGVIRLWKTGPKFYVHRLSAYIFHDYDMNHDELQVNHYCSNQNCWNPEHIYVGTQTDNMQDNLRAGNHYTRTDITHCKHGHEFTPENTYTWERDGKPERQCKKCRAIRQHEYEMKLVWNPTNKDDE